jgi:hypothetical protein
MILDTASRLSGSACNRFDATRTSATYCAITAFVAVSFFWPRPPANAKTIFTATSITTASTTIVALRWSFENIDLCLVTTCQSELHLCYGPVSALPLSIAFLQHLIASSRLVAKGLPGTIHPPLTRNSFGFLDASLPSQPAHCLPKKLLLIPRRPLLPG